MAPRSKGNGAKDTETPAAPGPEQVSPSVASALRRFDTFKGDDDEALAAELKDAHETASMLKNAQRNDGSIELQAFPAAVRSILEAFDVDGDGSVAPVELARAGELYQAEKQRSGRLKQLAIALAVLMAFVLAAVTGLTFSVVELSKETHTREDGVTLVAGTGGSSTGTVAKMAPVAQPQVLSSWLPDEAFATLETFKATSPGGSHLEMDVLGWYRVNETDSECNMYVSIVTYSGVIRLKGEVMTFEPLVGNAFAEAGFEVDASGRRLASVYDLIGLFNSIEEWVMLDPCADNRPPSFGRTDFVMEYDVEYKCWGDECTDIEGHAHGAMNADGTALVVSHRAEYDLHIGAVLESFTNQEFRGYEGAASRQYIYKHAGVELEYQLTDGDAFYCKSSIDEEAVARAAESTPGIAGDFDVSKAVQVSRKVADDGRVLRKFEIVVEVDAVEYALLTNDGDGRNFDANQTFLNHTIVYIDEAETGNPVEFRLTENITMKVTSYFEYPVDLSSHAMPNCVECSAYKPECPSKLPQTAYLFDFKRHDQEAGIIDAELLQAYRDGTSAVMPYYAKDLIDDVVEGRIHPVPNATRRRLVEDTLDGEPEELQDRGLDVATARQPRKRARRATSRRGRNLSFFKKKKKKKSASPSGSDVNVGIVNDYLFAEDQGFDDPYPFPPPVCQSMSYIICPWDGVGDALLNTGADLVGDWIDEQEAKFSASGQDFWSTVVGTAGDALTDTMENFGVGKCWGSNHLPVDPDPEPEEVNLGLVKLEMQYYKGAAWCGVHNVDISGGQCPWGGVVFASFTGKTPALCGVTTCNMKLEAELGCRWDLMQIFKSKAPALVKPLEKAGAQATLEFKLTYEYPASLGLAVEGEFKLLKWFKIPFTKKYLETGIHVSFEASGTINLADRYLQLRAGFGGRACIAGICFGVSITLASPAFTF